MVVYQQTWHAGYIWDDNLYVTGNPTLRDLRGLWRIWFDIQSTLQYYPLVHTSFWVEYHLWGLNPLGYHLVNVFLHALGAVLLWRLLVLLEIPGARLAAAIFAVHPVEVESVAWITERKNVLSGVFYFAAALAYLHFVETASTRGSGWRRALFYTAALVLFLFALLSKTVTCSLPAALLLVRWWKVGRLDRQDILPLLPFFAIGLSSGLLTAWLEQHYVGAQGALFSFTFFERCLIASHAVWFYAGKLFWPANLTFIYPRWEISPTSAWQWLFPLGVAVAVVVLWEARKRIGRGPLIAVLFFIGTLAPALGFLNVYPFRYSFVADHFQYLASVGLIGLAAVGLNRLPRVALGGVLALLMMLTWRQVGVYRNLESLWRDTLNKNPSSWMVQNNFALVLIGKGQTDEAIGHLRKALELDANNVETHSNLGLALLESGRLEEAYFHLQKAEELEPRRAAVHYNLSRALLQKGRRSEGISQLQKALEIDPTYVPAYSDLGNLFLRIGRVDESLAHLQRALEIDPNYIAADFNMANTLLQMGRVDEAIFHLQKVLTINPNDSEAQKNMAWVLATCPDPRFRDGTKAVALAERARQTRGQDSLVEATLAAAYAEAGRFNEAVKTAEGALRSATDSGNFGLARGIREQIARYQSRQPYRDIRQ